MSVWTGRLPELVWWTVEVVCWMAIGGVGDDEGDNDDHANAAP